MGNELSVPIGQAVTQSSYPGNKRIASKGYAGWCLERGGFTKGGRSPPFVSKFFSGVFLKSFFRLRRRLRRGENHTIQVNPQWGALGANRARPIA